MFRHQSRSAVRRLSISTTLGTFSLITALTAGTGPVQPTGILSRLLNALISFTGLSIFLLVVDQIFHRMWARPILGKWWYFSKNSGNYGEATITYRNDELQYHVTLYRTLDDLAAAINKEPGASSRSGATAASRVLVYSASTGVDLVYEIRHPGEGFEGRLGFLHLDVFPGEMKGYWTSWSIGTRGRKPLSGELAIYREKAFRRVYLGDRKQGVDGARGRSA